MKERILSGIRPTGKMHMGNYLGAIANWVRFQEKAECFFMIADWHVLTTDYESHTSIRDMVTELAVDLLASGVDPDACTLFVQSAVPAHAELTLILSMITPLSWLERNPTFKEQIRELQGRELHTHGFLGYPVLQAADILLYNADSVPVGEDQLPHIELTREIVRRFNFIYGELFKEPKSLLTPTPKIPGTDGRKMSKSYNNCLYLSDTAEVLTEKVMKMLTDPARKRRHDPGDPDKCPVFYFHQIFNPGEVEEIREGCSTAAIGCIDCKKKLLAKLIPFMEPIWERRNALLSDLGAIESILDTGKERATQVATAMLSRVRDTIKI